jgi:hypothetical protein
MANPRAEIPGSAGNLVDGELWRLAFPGQERGLQRCAQLLIRIEREDPVVRGVLRGEVFLFGVTGPRAREEARAMLAGDFRGAVGAAGIDDHDFIGDGGQGSQRAGEMSLFIEGNDAGRERSHWWSDMPGIRVSISQEVRRAGAVEEGQKKFSTDWPGIQRVGWTFALQRVGGRCERITAWRVRVVAPTDRGR